MVGKIVAAVLSLCLGVASQSNVLIVLADDVGVDQIGAYGESGSAPPTPVIDSLAASGLLFRNAYTNPTCSPTRATLMTGRYSFRTGVGSVVNWSRGAPLQVKEYTLPEIVGAAGIETALIGKWHLGNAANGGVNGPALAGFGHYSGHFWNIFEPWSYFSWEKLVNGVTTISTNYVTTENADDAIAWIQQTSGPWLCVLSFTAAHAPFHNPPPHLHTQTLPTFPPDSRLQYKAMIQALDTELGRVFATLGPAVMGSTNVIFMGDNGSTSEGVDPPFNSARAKTTLYEGGINVPLIFSGPAVTRTGEEEASLTNSVDLFATAAELLGVDARAAVPASVPIDGVSLVPYLDDAYAYRSPVRTFAYSEQFDTTFATKEGQAIRGDRYKLIRFTFAGERFYDLAADPLEVFDLLLTGLSPAEQAEYDELALELDRLAADWDEFGDGCTGASGTPYLTTVGGSLPRLGGTFNLEVRNVAGAAVAGFVGSSKTAWAGNPLPFPVPGSPSCFLYVSLDVIVPLAVVGDVAPWSINVPNEASLVGLELHHQGWAENPGSPNTFSNGGTAVVGAQ